MMIDVFLTRIEGGLSLNEHLQKQSAPQLQLGAASTGHYRGSSRVRRTLCATGRAASSRLRRQVPGNANYLILEQRRRAIYAEATDCHAMRVDISLINIAAVDSGSARFAGLIIKPQQPQRRIINTYRAKSLIKTVAANVFLLIF